MNDSDFLVLDGKLAETLQHAVSETLADTFQIEALPKSWSVGRRVPLVLDSLEACQIGLRQEDFPLGTFIVAFSRDILQRILRQYSPNAADDQALIDDAGAELANMIFGLFKTSVNKAGHHLSMGIPLPLRHQAGDLIQYEQVEKMVLPFIADGQQCQVIIAQNR